MFIHHLVGASVCGLFGVVGLAASKGALVMVPLTAVGAYELTAGRFWSLVAGGLGLVGVVIGVLALIRSAGSTSPRSRQGRAAAAIIAGVLGAVIGGLVVASADGGPGTGSGVVGGFMALLIGLIALVLGGLALTRSRRTDSISPGT
jgi:hypothetical protein